MAQKKLPSFLEDGIEIDDGPEDEQDHGHVILRGTHPGVLNARNHRILYVDTELSSKRRNRNYSSEGRKRTLYHVRLERYQRA
jgi:hypothetical protein